MVIRSFNFRMNVRVFKGWNTTFFCSQLYIYFLVIFCVLSILSFRGAPFKFINLSQPLCRLLAQDYTGFTGLGLSAFLLDSIMFLTYNSMHFCTLLANIIFKNSIKSCLKIYIRKIIFSMKTLLLSAT